MMSRDISHTGTVVEVSSHSVTISIDTTSDNCNGCSARLLCRRNGESPGDTVIDVPVTESFAYKVGDKVSVSIPEHSRISALFIALIMPCICLLLAVIILSLANFNDAFVAIGALAAVAAYFAILFVFRNLVRERYNKMKICHQ